MSRCLWFVTVLTGSVGTEGGTNANGWNKFIPVTPIHPEPQGEWNDLTWPAEYPLTHHELSILLPHFLKSGRGKLDTYFTRVYNPLWTNPDGFTWLEVLADPEKVGCHVALTPTWNESAWYADYVLPMGVASERHDVGSFETHNGMWIGFRQPVLRRHGELEGESFDRTHEANPGEVWEEQEFWIDLSWRIDPDGSLGIRRQFESRENPGTPLTLDEYYTMLFEGSVPGLPEAAEAEGLTPLEYMRRKGAFALPGDQYRVYERDVADADLVGTEKDAQGVYRRPGTAGSYGSLDEINGHMPFIGDGSPAVDIAGEAKFGFPTPSKKLELFSETMRDWGWPEYTTPTFIRSHVHWEDLDIAAGERILVPTFRIPTLIHTRSANSEWLNEISHRHPLWVHPSDAEELGIEENGLVRITTRIGHFVIAAWRTEGIRPGVVAASHHMGRWRLDEDKARSWGAGKASVERESGRPLAPAPRARQPAVRQRRAGHRPHLVVRHGRPPEPDLPRAARPGQRHALLVAAGDGRPGTARRRLRRRRGRHRGLTRRVRGVAGQDASRSRPRRPASTAVVRSPRQAEGDRLPGRLSARSGFGP